MNCSMPGFPVHHHLPELFQNHVHCIGNAIQPSHPLLSRSPPAFSFSQHKAAATLQARVQPGLLLRRSARGQAGGDVRHLQRGRIPTEPLRPGSQTTPDSRRRLLPTALTNLGCGFFFKKKDEKINQIVLTMQGRHTPCENDWPVTPVG